MLDDYIKIWDHIYEFHKLYKYFCGKLGINTKVILSTLRVFHEYWSTLYELVLKIK